MKIIKKLVAILVCLMLSNTLWSQSLPPQPTSMEALVEFSDLIIIGKLKSIVDSRKFYGYQENADELERIDALSSLEIGIPIVDYELKINQILKGQDIGQAIIIRNTNDYVADVKETNKFLTHDAKIRKQVFFLNENPDGLTYGVNSVMGIMDFKKVEKKGAHSTKSLSSEELVYYSKGKEYVPFGIKTSADETLQSIVDINLANELR